MTDVATPQRELLPATDHEVIESEGLSETPKSFGRLAWERFVRHRLAIIGFIGLVLITMLFIVGPMISKYGFEDVDVVNRRQGPSWDHPFGTDTIGRDLFTRTTYGGRYSLRIGITVALLATAIGTVLGAIAGFFGKWIDTFVSQVINLVLIVPALLVLSVFALKWGAKPNGIALVLGALLWTRIARVVRGVVMQFKEQEFVMAARAAGASSRRIITRHIMPNVIGPVVVEVTLLLGTAIVLESTLSFLGLGVKPPIPTLGTLVAGAKGDIDSDPIKVLLPGFMIVIIVLCVNFLGDGLRDALDPRSRVEKD
jgi:ABC-type dipeptide/oligopeptide/nickel transport system permease subunit